MRSARTPQVGRPHARAAKRGGKGNGPWLSCVLMRWCSDSFPAGGVPLGIMPKGQRIVDLTFCQSYRRNNPARFRAKATMAGSGSGSYQRPSTRAPQPLPPPLKRTSSLPSKVAAARRAGHGAPPSAGKHLRPWAPRFDEELFAKGFNQRHVLFLPKNAERNRPIIPIEWHAGQPLPGTHSEAT